MTGIPDQKAVDPQHDRELTFPDQPRLELDQLLQQLVERANEVIGTQGRLRGLLRANQVIGRDLGLPVVLRRVAEAARELVGARYAALGVIAPEGGLAEFVHVGMPADAVDRIGHLPQGKGLLGALIDDPRPIRLDRIADDVRSSGFPPGHPTMESFLGVPIRVRDEIFGNLYLAESTTGTFSAEDEELTNALATTAGVAIANARLYEAARQRQEWLRASATITRRLLSADAGDPLQLIVDSAREIADADLATVVLPVDDNSEALTMRVAVADGAAAEQVRGMHLPVEGTLSGRVYATGEPLLASWTEERVGLRTVVPVDLDIGPMLIVPLLGTHRVNGVLTAGRRAGRPRFTSEDLDMAAGFANQASIAVELAEARAEQQRSALLDDRDRIAADLHDQVIQQLFAAGLSLQSVATTLSPGTAKNRILATVSDLDDTIRQIRTTIFELQPTAATAAGTRARLLDVIAEQASALGFSPTTRFTGILDTLPADITEDLAAVLREALANIARHAAARSADVDLTATADRVTLTVADDGAGIRPTNRRSGLANLQRRAERRGGTFAVAPRRLSGTELSWSVPLPR
jgi:signal transduction histidine kinase